MRVSLAEVQRYARTLARLSDLAENRANSSIALWMTMHPDATVAECREFAILAVREAVARYGDAAATNAATLYDQTMEREGTDVPPATIWDGPDGDAIEGTVRRQAGRLAGEEPDREGFARQLGRYAADQTREAASQTVVQNVSRDSKTRKGRGVRYARVPQRADPCGYCVMLASRGFVYRGEDEAAAGSHHNCTCLIVPGIDGKTKVDGYDPKGMYDRYEACRKTIEHDLRAEQRRLRAADAYDADAFNEWCKQRIVAEMNTRDRRWLKTGIPSRNPSIAKGATPDEWESKVADILWDNGVVVEFQPRSLSLNDRRADTLISGKKWEIKNPTGNNPLTTFNQFKSVVFGKNKHFRNPQADCLIISNVRSEISASELIRQAKEVMAAGEFPEIKQVLIVDRDSGLMYRVIA